MMNRGMVVGRALLCAPSGLANARRARDCPPYLYGPGAGAGHSRFQFLDVWLQPGLLAAFLMAWVGLSAMPGIAASSEHDFAVKRLEARARQQEAASASYRTFHDFKFVDGLQQSGILFDHRIVDDARRTYRAAHYDHGNGVALADVDGDGLIDIYFTTQLGTNQLWRNSGGGRFEDWTARAGVGLPDQISVGAAFGDFDNDGDPDLFVTTVRHGNHLFENLGGGRYRDVTREAGLGYVGHSSGAFWVDVDNDGLLDLVVVNIGSYTTDEMGPGGYHRAREDAFQGHLHPARSETSILYRNLGGGHFKDVSREWGFKDVGWTGDGTFIDLNGDGFMDLYLVNMQGDDHFHENRGGKGFTERTASYFPKTPWGAMGVKFFDFNRDGLPDLYVTDMHSDMTQPQTEKALAFRVEVEKSKSEAWCRVQWPESYYQGTANNIFGNAFYQNLGGGRFSEVSDALGVETYWPWGVSVGDLNADGFEDIFVTAGMGYPFRYALNSLLLNEAGTRFVEGEFVLGVEPRSGGRTEKTWFSLDCGGADRGNPLCAGFTGTTNILGTLSSRSSAIADLDDDGDLDIVTNEFFDRPQVLFSDLASRKKVHFLKVKLVGRSSNRDGLGAKVVVRFGGGESTQYCDGKSGYLAQSSLPLYFGLGEAGSVDEVRVVWPSGKSQSVTKDIPGNGVLRVEEPER